MSKKAKIAIIGGGVAGASTALYLSKLGVEVTLFERETSLVNGPPFCHLHAGGNLYPDISDEQCIKLLKQSIAFLRFYPHVVDYRPTVIALPSYCSSKPSNLLPRLEKLQQEYALLIENDPKNRVLGESEEYYRLYSQEKILAIQKGETSHELDKWMIPVAQNIDLSTVQFPLVLVQEYGLNLFRLGASVGLALDKIDEVNVRFNTPVTHVKKDKNQWKISYEEKQENFDYLINATGFRTGIIDDFLDVPCKKMVEFKAAYVTKWEEAEGTLFPEIIFHGERGTPQGMGQFTPYPNGYFQLHGMTNEITLYEDGLVASTALSCQPQLKANFMEKIEKSWSKEEVELRTKSAIRHLSKFIPNFSEATVGSKPLFGAQQIPGDDPLLRVAEVSFPTEKYARCEIVKVSSVIDMIDTIVDELIGLGYVDTKLEFDSMVAMTAIKEEEITSSAQAICLERGYPLGLASLSVLGI
ncbi:MAG: FAD-binding oxidoreductase [Sulfurovaceae bacterium]|nr:FAD-binding oxidoreductase [Sulfurovaceae bacterium]